MADFLIAGCGYVGTALAKRLVASGNRVWGLRRSPMTLPGAVMRIAADLDRLQPEDLPEVHFDTVFYLAGPATSADEDYERAYALGPARLAAALGARLSAVNRIFFASSTRVFAQNGGDLVDEESATEADDFRSRRLLEGEASAALLGPPATVVRFAGIYGPRRERLMRRLLSPPDDRRATFYTNRIHRDDAAGFLAHLAELETPRSLYLGVDSEPATQEEIHGWLAQADRERAETRPDMATSVGGAQGKRCSNRRLLDSGYRLDFPSFKDGYSALLRESGIAPPTSL